jgi:GNAT superfamily N-acetyltransferase
MQAEGKIGKHIVAKGRLGRYRGPLTDNNVEPEGPNFELKGWGEFLHKADIKALRNELLKETNPNRKRHLQRRIRGQRAWWERAKDSAWVNEVGGINLEMVSNEGKVASKYDRDYDMPFLRTHSELAEEFQGSRLGTALYLAAYDLARKSGYKGILSSQFGRSQAAAQVWQNIRNRRSRMRTSESGGSLASHDILDSLSRHRRKRGKKKRRQRDIEDLDIKVGLTD